MQANSLVPRPRLRPLAVLALFPLLATLASSCRTSPQEVVLFYPPRALDISDGAAPALGPAAPTVCVGTVRDRRARPQVVGVTRGLASIVLGRIHASNDGGVWVSDAAEYELRRAGLEVVEALADQAEGADAPRFRLELDLLEARAASDIRHPGQVVLAMTLRLDGSVLAGRRVTGVSTSENESGVHVDAAESLAVALRDALRPVARSTAALALEEARLTPEETAPAGAGPSLDRDADQPIH